MMRERGDERCVVCGMEERFHTPNAYDPRAGWHGYTAPRVAEARVRRGEGPAATAYRCCNQAPSKYGCELMLGHDGPCRALVGTPGVVSWMPGQCQCEDFDTRDGEHCAACGLPFDAA